MNEQVKRSFGFNLVVVLLLCVGLYILFFTSLRWITRHGDEVRIPKVTGTDMHAAVDVLQKNGFEVYVDSTYEPKLKPFIVLSQMPDVNAIVKTGRTIFLTVNKSVPPTAPMPNLISLSFRSAEMILKNNKLILGDTTFKPDIAKGAVLEQLYNGAQIRPGQMIPQGSRISLVIGDGLGIVQFPVPDVIGMTYEEGTISLEGNGLQYTTTWDADVTDSATAIIYNQSPKPKNETMASNRIKAGDIIDLHIKQNPTADEMENNRNPSKSVDSSGVSHDGDKKGTVPAPDGYPSK
jgi:beta-lactam-binding protein with PASTA domain